LRKTPMIITISNQEFQEMRMVVMHDDGIHDHWRHDTHCHGTGSGARTFGSTGRRCRRRSTGGNSFDPYFLFPCLPTALTGKSDFTKSRKVEK